MDIVTLASVPAILALVNLAKECGLPSKLAPVAALIFGVLVVLVDSQATGGVTNWLQEVSYGVILGLSAAGVYDGAKLIGGKPVQPPTPANN